MRSDFDPDRLVTDWLDDIAPPRAPDGLLGQVLDTTATARRRPGWVIPERWLPMALFLRPRTYARTAGVVLMLILAGLLAVAGVVGSQPDRHPAPPFGLARNGLIAFDSNGDIWLADADGSDARALTSGPNVDINPTWSPDGTLLAYWSIDDPKPPSDGVVTQEHINDLLGDSTAALMVTDQDGDPPTSLIKGITLDSFGLPPSWAPDSRRIVFGHIADGLSVIDTVDLEGVSARITDGEAPSWSPDGSAIAFKRPNQGVMVVGLEAGAQPQQVTATVGSGFAFTLPQWSPDASMLTFIAGADGAHDVWVVRADGTGEHAVSTDFHDEYWPYWSPDGSRIAYGRVVSGASQAQGNFVTVDADGSDEVVLPQLTAGGPPTTWSPDGTVLIAFRPEDLSSWGVAVDLIDPTGVAPDLLGTIDAGSPFNSSSWQRLAP